MSLPVRPVCVLVVAAAIVACDPGGKNKNADAAKSAGESPAQRDPPRADGDEPEAAADPLGTVVVPPANPPSGVRPTLPSLDEDTRRRASELAQERERRFFPGRVRIPANGPALLYLALTSEVEAEVIAALNGVDLIYTPREQPGHRKAGADYCAVVLYRLTSETPAIAETAFDAAKTCVRLDEPSGDPVRDALVHFAFHHPKKAGRGLALKALSPRWTPTPEVQDAFLYAIDEEDVALKALALERVSFNFGHRFSKHQALKARLEPLLAHRDPAVRGTAVAALAESSLGHNEQEVARALLPLVEDPHPFVRAAALSELGMLRYLPAAKTVLEHVDSKDPARHKIPWTRLDGGPDDQSLLLHEESVGLVAVDSLEDMTKKTEHPFVFSKVGAKDADGGLAHAAEEARRWFQAHGAELAADGA